MAHRVLVIRPGALGDIIVTLPTIQTLVRARNQVTVELMGSLPVIEWLVGRSAVAAISLFDRRDMAGLFTDKGSPPPDSLTEYLSSFNLVINYAAGTGGCLSRNLRRLCRQVLELDVRPEALPAGHIADYLQGPLAALGIEPTADAPRISPLPSDCTAATDWLKAKQAHGRPLIAIHPGSGSREKNWAPGHFAEVIRSCTACSEALVMLIRGPADDAAAVEVIRATSGLNVLELEQPVLPQLAALLGVCQVYLGNDSGVSHLAAAVGAPSVILFGPTDPVTWAPRGRSVRVLRSSAECSPCTAERRRSCPDHRCLNSIPVDRVIVEMEVALREHLGQAGPTTLALL